jgi:hypothetical protein
MRRAYLLVIFALFTLGAVAACQHDVILGEPAADMAYPKIDMTQSVPPADMTCVICGGDLTMVDLATQDLAH